MRVTAYRDALFDEEDESRVPEGALKMKFSGFETEGAESGIRVTDFGCH